MNERKSIGAGIYIEGDRVEIDVPEMLAHFNYEDTEANRDLCEEIASKAILESGLCAPNAKQLYNHKHFCPRHNRSWVHDGKRKKCKLSREAFCPKCLS